MIAGIARHPLPRFNRLAAGDMTFVGLAILVLYAEMVRHFLSAPLSGLLQHSIVLIAYACILSLKTIRGRLDRLDMWSLVLATGLIALSLIGSYSRGVVTAGVSTFLIIKLAYISTIAAFFGLQRVAQLIPVMATIQICGLIVNLALPQVMSYLTPQVYLWLEQTDLVGFQLNVNRFGILGSLLCTWYIFLRPNAIMAAAMLASLILSGSRSGLLLLVLFLSYFAMRGSARRQAIFATALLLAAGPVGFVFRDQIASGLDFIRQSYMLETSYIRFIMFAHGLDLSLASFPFGTGGGTFGSPLSRGSAIYHQIGIAQLPTVAEGYGLNDSGIGSLLGEYGFAGLALVTISAAALMTHIAPDRLNRTDIAFLIMVFLVGSFFRAMISSYYYATLMVLLVVMLSLHEGSKSTRLSRNRRPV